MEEKLSKYGFIETVGTALERLRDDHPEIDWIVDEDDQIVVWCNREKEDK